MRISDWSSDVCSSDLAASRSCRYSLLEALQVAGLLAVLARGGGARGGRTDRTQRRVFRAAEIESEGAALPVGAALRQVLQVGRLAGDRRQRRGTVLVDARHRFQHTEGVGMLRAIEDVAHRPLLDHAAGVHDHYPAPGTTSGWVMGF